MLEYLLKSGACLAIFLLFYKLFLEQEDMHVLKRFYLLAALVLAFAIPLVVFTEYTERPPAIDAPMTARTAPPQTVAPTGPAVEAQKMDLSLLPLSIYLMGASFFGLKFLRNIAQVIGRIRKNPKYRKNRITNVLLQDLIVPHTFFRFIFLNKQKFESREIPEAVLLHEETHANQRHSLDVLLIEILQVLFWFNPLIYITKKAIKLNHEFLADQAVIKKGVHTATYQKILLAFSSSAKEPFPMAIGMANAINYSSIKKRFTVMKAHTPKRTVWFKSFFLLPLVAVLLLSFSTTEVKYTDRPETFGETGPEHRPDPDMGARGQDGATPEMIAEFNAMAKKYNARPIQGRIIKKRELERLEHLYSIMTDRQKDGAEAFPECPPPPPQEGATPEMISSYNMLAKKYNNGQLDARKVESGELTQIKTIYDSMTAAQKKEAEPLPPYVDPGKRMPQDGASREQLAEYNALAQKYNDMLEADNGIRIEKRDVDRLEYLYGLMGEDQKKNAQPFPEFPPMPEPPPPPPPTEVPEIIEIRHDVVPDPSVAPEVAVVADGVEIIEVAPVAPEPAVVVVPVIASDPEIDEIRVVAPIVEVDPEIVEVLAPHPPRAPKSPVHSMEEMVQKDAVFYHNGKEILSDKAIQLVRDSKRISVKIRHTGLKRPIVELSTKPSKAKVKED